MGSGRLRTSSMLKDTASIACGPGRVCRGAVKQQAGHAVWLADNKVLLVSGETSHRVIREGETVGVVLAQGLAIGVRLASLLGLGALGERF